MTAPRTQPPTVAERAAVGAFERAACGQNSGHHYATTGDRAAVTCKRCLATLAKRDRGFQRKARMRAKVA